jgi:hypothetical protein
MQRIPMLKVAILSAWLILTPVMWFAATKSFSTVDRVLRAANPQFNEAAKGMAEAETRMVLRHLASEINRSFFWGYGLTQIVLGGVLLLLLWRVSPRDALGFGVVCFMLGLVLILTLVLTPMIVSVGRSIDFVPRNPPPPVMPRFWALHGAFTGLDGVKFVAGLGLLVRWVLRG